MRYGRFTDGYEADYVHTGSSQLAATGGLHDRFGAPTDILPLYPPNYSPRAFGLARGSIELVDWCDAYRRRIVHTDTSRLSCM